jgi:hypothetical protein
MSKSKSKQSDLLPDSGIIPYDLFLQNIEPRIVHSGLEGLTVPKTMAGQVDFS